MPRNLSQLERDLEGYTLDKVTNVIKDVAQAFEIAGVRRGESLSCMGATFLRLAAVIAVTVGISKDVYMGWAAACYDREDADKKED